MLCLELLLFQSTDRQVILRVTTLTVTTSIFIAKGRNLSQAFFYLPLLTWARLAFISFGTEIKYCFVIFISM